MNKNFAVLASAGLLVALGAFSATPKNTVIAESSFEFRGKDYRLQVVARSGLQARRASESCAIARAGEVLSSDCDLTMTVAGAELTRLPLGRCEFSRSGDGPWTVRGLSPLRILPRPDVGMPLVAFSQFASCDGDGYRVFAFSESKGAPSLTPILFSKLPGTEPSPVVLAGYQEESLRLYITGCGNMDRLVLIGYERAGEGRFLDVYTPRGPGRWQRVEHDTEKAGTFLAANARLQREA